MNHEPEPLSMTVYRKPNGDWWIRLEHDSGEAEDLGKIGWDGEGGFYNRGLDFVVSRIPKGYVYPGAGSWQETEDGPHTSYTAVLYRRHPGFG